MAATTAPTQPRHLRPIIVIAAAMTIALASYGVAARRATPPSTASAGSGVGAAARDDVAVTAPGGPVISLGSLEQIDHAIALWSRNLARESRDFYSATNLGMLYEGRARLTGDISDYLRAREALEEALATEPHETSARVVHARVLASMHDFPGALAEARAILKDDPGQLPALATAGDAELELGDVTAAKASFEALAAAAPGPAVDARLSRLAFIQGRADDAWRLANGAYAEALAAGTTGPGLSWYAYVVGTLAITAGQPATALEWFDTAVSAWPGSYLAVAGKARAEAGLGQTDAAIADYRAAIAIAPQPDALAALGDLYAIAGDARLAGQQYDTVEAIAHLAALNEQVFNRQLVLFSINHDRDLPEALTLATRELAVRKDAYGYDAYAWALLANGRAADADVAIRQALGFGTAEPLFDYHAGSIAAALGQLDRARQLLAAALAPQGALDPLARARATAALSALGTAR